MFCNIKYIFDTFIVNCVSKEGSSYHVLLHKTHPSVQLDVECHAHSRIHRACKSYSKLRDVEVNTLSNPSKLGLAKRFMRKKKALC